jgi:hypothetical protein
VLHKRHQQHSIVALQTASAQLHALLPVLTLALHYIATAATPTVITTTSKQMWKHSARLGSEVASPYDSPVGLIESFDRIAAGASYSSVIAAMGLQEDPATEELFQQWEERVKLYNLDPTRGALSEEVAEAWDLPPLAPKPPNQVSFSLRQERDSFCSTASSFGASTSGCTVSAASTV